MNYTARYSLVYRRYQFKCMSADGKEMFMIRYGTSQLHARSRLVSYFWRRQADCISRVTDSTPSRVEQIEGTDIRFYTIAEVSEP